MSTAIFEAVLGNLAVAGLLAIVAAAVGRWANRPALAHALWLLTLVKLVTPPVVALPIQCLPPPTDVVTPGTPVSQNTPIVAPVAVAASLPSVPPPVALVPSVPPPPLLTGQPFPAAPPLEATARWRPTWDELLLGVWAVGVVISLGVALRRSWRFTRLLSYATAAPRELVEEVAATAERMGLRSPPRVRVVPGGIAPLVWAVGRPTLYLPTGLLARLSADQRLTLVAHELAHLRRWDHVVRAVEFVAVAVCWWCPLAWLARRELRRLEEEACDADVVATVPGSGYVYASAILETIDYLAGVAPAPAMASGIGDVSSLRRRLTLILGGPRPARISSRTRLAVLAAAFGLLAVGPELHKLAAETDEDAAFASDEPTELRPSFPVVREEPFVEAVQFLPRPTPLLAPGTGSPVLSSTLSPDGSRLAMATGTRVSVVELASKKVLFTLDGHRDTVNAVAFSPDGRRIATVGSDTLAILWDGADGRRLHTLSGHSRWVLAAAFSPDGRTLATGSYDRSVRLWDVRGGKAIATWTGYAAGVRSLAYSPDGRTVATGGADGEVRVWDAHRDTTIHSLKKQDAAVRVVAFSPDGMRLASGSEDGTVALWNPTEGRAIGRPVAMPDFVTALAFSRHGRALFVGTFGGHLLRVDPRGAQLCEYIGVEPGEAPAGPPHAGAVTAISATPGGTSLVTVSQDGAALAWPSAGLPQPPRRSFRSAHRMTAVALSPDGATLATGGQDGVIRLWAATTARELARLPGHRGGVSSLVFGAGGRLVSAGADERVRVWDVASGRATRTLVQPTADLRVALSPDGRTLAVGGNTIRGVTLLDLESRAKPRSLGEWAGEATSVAFHPSGGRLLTGDSDGFVRAWNLATGEELLHARVGTGSVDGLSFDAAGGVVAVVMNEGVRRDDAASGPSHEVVFLTARDGAPAGRLRPLAHAGPVTAAAFAADGRVLTAGRDGNLYVWDPAAAKVERTIRGHVDAVRGVALTADGTAVFSAGDRTAKKWPMTKGAKP